MAGVAFSETHSLCPECLARIPGVRFQHGPDVYLRKICPEHGQFDAILWRGEPSYARWTSPRKPWHNPRPATSRTHGCPFDCGLCPDHAQQTCTALVEVTQRCSLGCAFCFANGGMPAGPEPDPAELRDCLEQLHERAGYCNLQISGGEPAMRDDVPAIIDLARAVGFHFVQLNTNGLRLAEEPRYAEKLRAAGLDSVFLQFDGIDDGIHQTLRGRPLAAVKAAAIDACAAHDIGVVLVPTVVPGVNDRDLGRILQLAVERLPAVRGVHFQPVSYFGRYPRRPDHRDRITIPEILRSLERQTNGLVTVDDFGPPSCENARCSFRGSFVAMPNGELKAFPAAEAGGCCPPSAPAEHAAARARAYVSRQWGAPDASSCRDSSAPIPFGEWDAILQRARTHRISVTGMAFQDVWNVNLERVKDCCIHVARPDGRLVPFCLHNLTSRSGRLLYPRQGRE